MLIDIYCLLDNLVVECWPRVREVPGSIPSQGPPPRYPSGIVLASSAGGPGSIHSQGPPPRYPSGIVLASSAGGPGSIHSQGPPPR